MAIHNFIATVWSETLYRALDKQYVAAAHCNREFEGDIKEKGDRVKICGLGAVTVSDYVKDTDMSTPQTLSDNVRELVVNRAKYFNFQIDDVDRAQSTPKLMSAAMESAASALANEADAYLFGLYTQAGHTVSCEADADKVLDAILSARRKLYESNVGDTNEVVLEVSPTVAELILKAKLNVATDNAETLESGCLGSVAGCKVYVSNNIATSEDEEEETKTYHCLMRTRRAVAYAEQLNEVCAYRPEHRFADAVKGLHLYGAKVVYPSEMVLVDVTESVGE